MQNKSLREFKTIEERRKFLENKKNISLRHIGAYHADVSIAQEKNCENMIGTIQVPVGVAGPLSIKGMYTQGDFYIPLATTEGALVASINRGAKAITQSGGACATTECVGITRGVVFETSGIMESQKTASWIQAHKKEIQNVAQSTSHHLQFLDIFITWLGTNVFVRFSYDPKDAMGMNMATFATDAACSFIQKELAVRLVSLAGNFDVDKKSSWLNFILGRGRKAWAQATISNDVLKTVLKVSAEKIHEVSTRKNMLGSALSGSLGMNAHFANSIAALFIATGQDVAHTTEGSLGVTTTDVRDSQLSISVYLPDLILGTIGGGTMLPTQKEALDLLGVSGGDEGKNAASLAEITAGVVLCGELSLLASLAEQTLSKAHRSLARSQTV